MTDVSIHELIRAIEQADSPGRLIGAVRALAARRSEAAVPTLIQVLGYNNPGAAVAAVDGLVQLGSAAVPPLLAQIDGYNYGARAYAVRALAAIADPRALTVLLEAAETDFAPSVRRAAAKGVGFLRWQLLPAAAIVPAQLQAFHTLAKVSEDSDWAIRYAAIVGLQALAIAVSDDNPNLLATIRTRLDALSTRESDAATRSRIQLAQQTLDRLEVRPSGDATFPLIARR